MKRNCPCCKRWFYPEDSDYPKNPKHLDNCDWCITYNNLHKNGRKNKTIPNDLKSFSNYSNLTAFLDNLPRGFKDVS